MLAAVAALNPSISKTNVSVGNLFCFLIFLLHPIVSFTRFCVRALPGHVPTKLDAHDQYAGFDELISLRFPPFA